MIKTVDKCVWNEYTVDSDRGCWRYYGNLRARSQHLAEMPIHTSYSESLYYPPVQVLEGISLVTRHKLLYTTYWNCSQDVWSDWVYMLLHPSVELARGSLKSDYSIELEKELPFA